MLEGCPNAEVQSHRLFAELGIDRKAEIESNWADGGVVAHADAGAVAERVVSAAAQKVSAEYRLATARAQLLFALGRR